MPKSKSKLVLETNTLDFNKGDLLEIEGKQFEIIGLGWNGEYDKNTQTIINHQTFILHKQNSSEITPTHGIVYYSNKNKMFWEKTQKEIPLNKIKKIK